MRGTQHSMHMMLGGLDDQFTCDQFTAGLVCIILSRLLWPSGTITSTEIVPQARCARRTYYFLV